jgi:hypothetical protein
MNNDETHGPAQLAGGPAQARPEYVKPVARLITEAEILNTCQVSVSASSWWAM